MSCSLAAVGQADLKMRPVKTSGHRVSTLRAVVHVIELSFAQPLRVKKCVPQCTKAGLMSVIVVVQCWHELLSAVPGAMLGQTSARSRMFFTF